MYTKDRFLLFLSPGPLPLGYRFQAQQCSEATHEIPISGFHEAMRDYRQLLWEIESFVSPEGSRDIPAVFSKVKQLCLAVVYIMHCALPLYCVHWETQ